MARFQRKLDTMATTSTISSLGVGSGLDAESIVTKLVALERQSITKLEASNTTLQTKISTYGKVQSSISALNDAAQKLTDSSLWNATTATSADNVAVSFATTSGASTGNYSVGVNALASSQSVVSNTTFASSSALVGAGSLVIDQGTWNGNVFSATTSGRPPITITSTDTLADVRDKINGANAGVTAAIVNDATGSRLVMTSKDTGLANGFRVQSGLTSLAYDPQTNTTGTTRNQAASDAEATINGITVKSSSNTFANVLSGVSFTIGKTTTSPVNVSVTQDTAAITKAITDFASAYSSLTSMLSTNTKYDEGSKKAGTLQGDSMAVSTLNRFRALLGNAYTSSSTFGTLSSIGLETKTGGAVSVNATKLSSALDANLAEVKKFFSNTDLADPSKNGFAVAVRDLTNNLLSTDGAITTRTDGLKSTVKLNDKRMEQLETKAALYEKRLRAQYTALDESMARISAQGNLVTQMITAFNKGSSN